MDPCGWTDIHIECHRQMQPRGFGFGSVESWGRRWKLELQKFLNLSFALSQ